MCLWLNVSVNLIYLFLKSDFNSLIEVIKVEMLVWLRHGYATKKPMKFIIGLIIYPKSKMRLPPRFLLRVRQTQVIL